MCHNQLKHLPKNCKCHTKAFGFLLFIRHGKKVIFSIVNFLYEIYYRKDNFLAMSYKQKKSQMKPVIMLSTFLGANDVAHCKDDSKSVPATVDTYNKHMGGIGKSYQILSTYLDERKSLQWTKK